VFCVTATSAEAVTAETLLGIVALVTGTVHLIFTETSSKGKLTYPAELILKIPWVCTYKRLKKGKAVPLQAWSGPEGSRKLRFPDYMTTAQDGGKVVRPTHRAPLPPGNAPG